MHGWTGMKWNGGGRGDGGTYHLPGLVSCWRVSVSYYVIMYPYIPHITLIIYHVGFGRRVECAPWQSAGGGPLVPQGFGLAWACLFCRRPGWVDVDDDRFA